MTSTLNQSSPEKFRELVLQLYSDNEEVRVAAIPEILKHGELGKSLVINIINTEKGQVQEAAMSCIFDFFSEEIKFLKIDW